MVDNIIPAIKSAKELDRFLKMDFKYCILMGFHISILKSLVEKIHKHDKKCILHIDLLNGISSDEYGAEYAIQHIGADGLASTKFGVIKTAKKLNVISIFRIFLIDTYSLNKSIKKISEIDPDYVEVLPAIAHHIIKDIKNEISIPIIGGGLIRTKEEINECINSGMVAVTTSDHHLWKK